jgi:hypothetical protein
MEAALQAPAAIAAARSPRATAGIGDGKHFSCRQVGKSVLSKRDVGS